MKVNSKEKLTIHDIIEEETARELRTIRIMFGVLYCIIFFMFIEIK